MTQALLVRRSPLGSPDTSLLVSPHRTPTRSASRWVTPEILSAADPGTQSQDDWKTWVRRKSFQGRPVELIHGIVAYNWLMLLDA